MSAEWSKSGTILHSNSRVTVAMEPVRVGPRVYHTFLVFGSLDSSGGDEGNYTCTGIVALSGSRQSVASATSNIAIESECQVLSVFILPFL